ncbi:MAG: 5'/3'-nucleotidase SurE [Desulfobulbaceae bacterium]|nr:5'/3'-nucleotidase SurE [Desulfobulbaceae bacterium]HIJ89250.1 5'/3'-nucleotidase SurE [Deltaproteobacteria bacterium]
MTPLILVTNDDGVRAPGLAVLAKALEAVGQIVIVAPDQDNSAASHSLTMKRPLRVKELGPNRYSVDGTPTDCVTLAVGKILLHKPHLVVSGINPGPNLGDDVSYSGTVSAAVEGTMLGAPSLAVSLVGEEPFCFETAAAFAVKLARIILDKGLPKDTLLNVNVPNRPSEGIHGVRFTRQGRRVYDGAIKETFDPWGRQHYWIGGGTPFWDEGEDTDAQAIVAGYVSVTPLHLDLTNHAALRKLGAEWTLTL